MSGLRASALHAVCFDLGNTLIPFGPAQLEALHADLERTLGEHLGPCDGARLRALRSETQLAPYRNGYRENDLAALDGRLVQALYGLEASPELLAAMDRSRRRAFLATLTLAPATRPLLDRLRPRYRLALLSNYPCARSIREGLDQLGLTDLFEVVVISGEVGLVKPHPRPFALMLEGLGLPPEACVYVGDNWLADIQGAKGAGLQAVHTTEHASYQDFEPRPGDLEPDARIGALAELEALL